MIQTNLVAMAQAMVAAFALAGPGLAQSTEATDTAAPDTAEVATAAPGMIATLPGGASSINDIYGSWTLSCLADAGGAQCAVTQVQIDQQSQQRLLSAEMARTESGAEGIALLPFGLDLDAGVSVQLGSDAAQEARFSTCVPGGCILPLTLDAAALSGTDTLTLTATIHDAGGEALNFAIPLNGLAQALERKDQVLAQ